MSTFSRFPLEATGAPRGRRLRVVAPAGAVHERQEDANRERTSAIDENSGGRAVSAPTLDRSAFDCPTWCVTPAEAHAADLAAWEGGAVHRSAEQVVTSLAREIVVMSTSGMPEGLPTGAPTVVLDGVDDLTPAEARALAAALLDAAAAAEAAL